MFIARYIQLESRSTFNETNRVIKEHRIALPKIEYFK